MENSNDYKFYTNGWDSSARKCNTARSNVGFNADIGDMCFIMLEYIKEAMKVKS